MILVKEVVIMVFIKLKEMEYLIYQILLKKIRTIN